MVGNALLVLVKYAAGILGHSSALIAEATNSLGDIVVDLVVLLGFRVVAKPIDASHDYGHGKVETLLSTFCGALVLSAGIGVGLNGILSIRRFLLGDPLNRPGSVVLPALLLTIFLKILLYRYTSRQADRLESMALRAKAWDHKSDVLCSVGTLLGVGGAFFLGEPFRFLDPAAAVGVSFFIARTGLGVMRESVEELLEASLDGDEECRIQETLLAVPGVRDCHGLRTRKIGFATAIDAHLLLDRDLSLVAAHDIATEAEQSLCAAFGNHTFVSLHVEPLPEEGCDHQDREPG
jgi:cation diffusion facilitator family transporter